MLVVVNSRIVSSWAFLDRRRVNILVIRFGDTTRVERSHRRFDISINPFNLAFSNKPINTHTHTNLSQYTLTATRLGHLV